MQFSFLRHLLKVIKVRFTLLCLLMALGCVLPAVAAPDGYCLKIQSALGGVNEALMTPKGLRFQNAVGGYTLICKAPDWTVYAFRDKTREIAHCSSKEFVQTMRGVIGTAASLDFSKKPKVRPVKFSRLGVGGWDYIYPGSRRPGELFQTAEAVDTTQVVVRTMDLGLPAPISDVISAVVCMPVLPGCLYQCLEYQVGGNVAWVVRGVSIERRDIADTTFTLPRGYTDKGKLQRYFLFKEAGGAIEAIFEGLEPARSERKKISR
ncbi:MAG: hypothetical protein JSS86_24260 [Cyanobacteria bacterium SZAS LIN-2]|nr:hypothetical protein [Cyanobacteria bacterium SZAS LIN-2]